MKKLIAVCMLVLASSLASCRSDAASKTPVPSSPSPSSIATYTPRTTPSETPLPASATATHTPSETPLPASATPSARLLFRSGFEEGVYIDLTPVVNSEDYLFIRGTDAESGYSWPIDILGASESALHLIQDDRRQAVNAEIQTVIGHEGTSTKALYQVENYIYNDACTQAPYEILNIQDGKQDLYIRYWIKLDDNRLEIPYSWRTFFEWKSKDYAEGEGFRLIAFIYTDENGHPFWHWEGDADPETPVWEIDNTDIPVPTGEWFLTEFYWHWSEGADGEALWMVNGEVIGDYFGPSTRNGKPIDFIMLAQIYGNANPKHQWIDDIEIWDGLPYERYR